MIEKLLFNNQILTNKKKIQRGRTQTINRQVRKIRKLQLLNNNDQKNEKIKKKQEKILEILICLKKLNLHEIIPVILTFDKTPSSVLTNGKASPFDIAIALLASNQILFAIAENLKKLLSLNDINTGWKSEILEIRRRCESTQVIDENKKTNKHLKSTKHPNSLDKNLQKTERTSGLNITDWREKSLTNTNAEPSPPKLLHTNKVDITSKSLFKGNLDESKRPYKKLLKITDPFFLTNNGDNYMSTVVVDRIQSESIQDGLVRRERRNNSKTVKKRAIRSSSLKSPQNIFLKLDQSEKHNPSSIGKQKLKPSIIEFSGQKIKFENDVDNMTVTSSNEFGTPKYLKIKNILKNIPNLSIKEDIHPSWAAKHRQNQAITEFKGSKITFDY